MAEFNPTTPGVSPNYTGASRGQIADTGFADLFEAASKAGFGALKAADFGVRESIKEDVYKAQDTVNDQFGITSSAGEAEAAMGSSRPPPPDLQDKLGQLELLNRAFASGKVKSYHYWGRLENEVKSLRNKYPGYRDVIDDTVSSITGSTPANALRSALLGEMDALNSSSKSIQEKQWTKVQENMEWMSPATYQGYNNGSVSFETAMTEAQQKQYKDKGNTVARNQFETDAAAGKLNKDRVVSQGILEMDQLQNEIFHDAGKAFNIQIDAAYEDGKITPDEVKGLTPVLMSLERDFNTGLQQIWSKENTELSGQSFNSFIGTEGIAARDAGIDQARKNFSLIIAAAKEGDFSLLKANQSYVEIMQGHDTLDFMNNSEFGRSLGVIKQLDAGPFLGAVMTEYGGKIYDDLVKNTLGVRTLEFMTPQEGKDFKVLQDFIPEFERVGGADAGAAAKDFIDMAITSITSPDAPAEVSKIAAHRLFDKENMGFLSTILPGEKSENHIRLFQGLTSPAVTQKIIAMNDPELLDNYRKWSYGQWPKLFSSYATDINSRFEYTSGGIGFVFDPEKIEIRAAADPKYMDSDVKSSVLSVAQIEAQEFNKVLNNLKPLMENLKDDPSTTVQSLMNSIGIDPKAIQFPEEEGSLEGTEEGKQSKNDEGEGKTNQIELASYSSPDFISFISGAEGTGEGTRGYNEVLAYGAYGGGDAKLTEMSLNEVAALGDEIRKHPDNPYNSGAVGKGQIVPKTLRSLISELGLTGEEKYDEKMQDKLIVALANRRGRDPQGLRQEWQGLGRRTDSQILAAFDLLATP